MTRSLLVILFLLCFGAKAQSQMSYLFVKKGYKKKMTLTEGSFVALRLTGDRFYAGTITLLLNDSIYIAGVPLARKEVREVRLRKKTRKKFSISPKELLVMAGGTALVTAGLALSNQTDFKEALYTGLAIGPAPLLIEFGRSHISLRRKKFRIGKRFRLQQIDFYLDPKRPF